MKTLQKGFTLIELMIVVAIIGILAAIAIPAYQDYTIRAQVSEGLTLASDIKAGVAEYMAQTGEWPVDEAAIGQVAGEKRGKYVGSVAVDLGTINIIYAGTANDGEANAAIDGLVLSIKPMLSLNNDVLWICGRANPITDAVEEDSAGTASGDDITDDDLVDKHLPSACRRAPVLPRNRAFQGPVA